MSDMVYQEDTEKIKAEADRLDSAFKKFAKQEFALDAIDQSFSVNKNIFFDAVLRVDKVKFYSKVFHDGNSASEYKEIAAYAYWIMKLSPISWKIESTHCEYYSHINEYFALYLIMHVIKACCKEKAKRCFAPRRRFIRDVFYSFRFRDLSIDALTLFIETLAFSYDIYYPHDADEDDSMFSTLRELLSDPD